MAVETIPTLPSRDLEATAAFYAPLGFAEIARWPGERLILRHDLGIELHFWCNPDEDPTTNEVACYLRFSTATEARALYDDWAATGVPTRGIPRLIPPRETDYGLLEWTLQDPDGTLVNVGGFLAED